MEVRAKVALCLLDFFSCCLAAQRLPWATGLLRLVGRHLQAPEAFQFGLPMPIAANDAAFGNGVLGHGVIREDMHVAGGSHVGVVVIPALLALAEREHLSGRALVTGIAVGYEAAVALGVAVRSGSNNRHFRPIGICGAFGATAGAAAALRLSEDIAVDALGYAANFAAGLNEWAWSGGQEIYVHAGLAARNALMAIDLAICGMTASETIIEGRDGVFAAYGSGPDAMKLFVDRLRDGKAILNVRHKPFSGCNFIQTPIACALSLRREEKFDPSSIAQIVILTFEAALTYPGCDQVGPFASVQQSKMSLQYGVSAALLHDRVDEEVYTRFEEPALHRLLKLCRVELVPEYNSGYPSRQPAAVIITLDDGRKLRRAMPDTPWLEESAVKQRFISEANNNSSRQAADAICEAVSALWDLPEASTLSKRLASL